jgi:hypothetical protein
MYFRELARIPSGIDGFERSISHTKPSAGSNSCNPFPGKMRMLANSTTLPSQHIWHDADAGDCLYPLSSSKTSD